MDRVATEMGKRKKEDRERERLPALNEGGKGDEDDGGGDEKPKMYKNAREEILAEFGNELMAHRQHNCRSTQ